MSDHPPASATSSSLSLSSLAPSLADPSDSASAPEPPDPFAHADDEPWDQAPLPSMPVSAPSREGTAPLPPSWPMTDPPSHSSMPGIPAPLPAPPSMPMPTSMQSLSAPRHRPIDANDSATFARLLREGSIDDSDDEDDGDDEDDEDRYAEYDTAVVPSHWISEEERWNTATFLSLTGHHATPRINRPPTRPLPRPLRFKRTSRIRSGALFIILLILLVVLAIGAGFAYRTSINAVSKFIHPTTQPTATPPIVAPTSVPTHKAK
ncbi:MAG: hypothetical protein ABI068_18270 [Ktedonobacterales bacterium]